MRKSQLGILAGSSLVVNSITEYLVHSLTFKALCIVGIRLCQSLFTSARDNCTNTILTYLFGNINKEYSTDALF